MCVKMVFNKCRLQTILVSIPLGIASYRNTKSVIYDDFVNLEQQKNQKFLLHKFQYKH